MNILQYIALDKYAKTPLYKQLSEAIEQCIAKGQLRHGDFLPPEKLLCDAYDVSPKVVLSAYQDLANKQLVIRHVGKGTKVNVRYHHTSSFSQILSTEKTMPLGYRVVYKDSIFTPDSVPIEATRVYAIHQVLQIEGFPFVYRKIYLKDTLYSVHDWDGYDLLYHTQAVLNIPVSNVETKLSVVNIPYVEASFLGVEKESPGFYLCTRIIDNDETIAYIINYYSGLYTTWEDSLETIGL
jgi:DNA-binding GntR family transcriptional regulator